jgi:hypothetical protein
MRRIIGLFTILALTIGGVAVPHAVLGQETQTANVTPAVGPPGARFAFVAFGFNANERIGVWVNTPGGEAIAITVERLNQADGDGRADWYWTAPADAQPGTWQLIARGLDSKVERVISFEIR